MTNEAVQSFSLRVTQANQSELTVITYEIILEYINDAKAALANGNREDYIIYNKKAREFMCELMAAVNYENPVSFNLIKLYTYVNKLIVKSLYSEDIVELQTAEHIMQQLLVAFKQVAAMDKSPSVMANTQQVYAGLTYGRGYLNETCLEDEPNRGFRA